MVVSCSCVTLSRDQFLAGLGIPPLQPKTSSKHDFGDVCDAGMYTVGETVHKLAESHDIFTIMSNREENKTPLCMLRLLQSRVWVFVQSVQSGEYIADMIQMAKTSLRYS